MRAVDGVGLNIEEEEGEEEEEVMEEGPGEK